MSVIPGGQLQYVHVFCFFFCQRIMKLLRLPCTELTFYGTAFETVGLLYCKSFCPLCASVRSTRCVKSEGEGFVLRDDGNWRGINLVSAF